MAEKTRESKCILALRVRGTIRAQREARETLQMLHLKRNNYAILIDDRPAFTGMLRAARGYVTWGEASKEAVKLIIETRGRLAGNRRMTEDYLKKMGYKSVDDLADAIFECRAEYWKLPTIQPAFKLRPPTKGYKGNIKKGFGAGGELGYRGDKINDLIERMV